MSDKAIERIQEVLSILGKEQGWKPVTFTPGEIETMYIELHNAMEEIEEGAKA